MTPVTQTLRHLAAAAMGRRPPSVLCYHGLGEEHPASDPHGLFITVAAFAAHLDALEGRGYRFVSVTELWAAVSRGGTEADGLGAITFDDGLAATTHVLLEVCAARDAVATVFLAPGLLGGDHPDLPPGRRILRADEVAGLRGSPVRVGAHSSSHVDLTTLTAEEQLEELRDSRTVLEGLLGDAVTTMAYPYGRYDTTTVAMAAEAGFEIACANDGAGPWRALELPREPVFPSTTPRLAVLKAAGLYAPMRAAGAARDALRARGR